MSRYLFITRTSWQEPPRLRHQVALLLTQAGHQVTFVQKPACLLPPSSPARSSASSVQALTLLRTTELLHHQLRLFPWLHQLNAFLSSIHLHRVLTSALDFPPDCVINFNYDSFWLRSLFSDCPIITIINDDFEALSRFPTSHHLTWALQRTCAMSTRVLTVSKPLQNRLAKWCDPELFYPWAQSPYRVPEPSTERNILLYWGYINERLDAVSLQACLPALEQTGLRLRFVGPLDDDGRQLRRQLGSNALVEWRPACSFADLDTSDCVAALIPYRLDCPGVEAIQLSNKALQLLSRGLPLITSAMPNFHRASFVLPYGTAAHPGLIDAALAVQRRFESFQPSIAEFVGANGPEARLRQLLPGVA